MFLIFKMQDTGCGKLNFVDTKNDYKGGVVQSKTSVEICH